MSNKQSTTLKIDLKNKKIFLGEILVPLQPMEFIYYLYFAERASAGLGPESLSDKNNLLAFLDKIIEYHREIFPDLDFGRKEHDKELIRLSLTRDSEPKLGNIRSIISKCNKKIREQLRITSLNGYFEIYIDGSRGGKTYGLKVPPENIQIPSPKVYPTFKRKVKCYSSDEPLSSALAEMKGNNFSQVVIKVQIKLRLITTDGLASWLIKMMSTENFNLNKASVNHILRYERDDNVSFFSRDRTVADARKEFVDTLSKNRPKLYAIIITETGKSNEEPLGIITPWDFLDPKYW